MGNEKKVKIKQENNVVVYKQWSNDNDFYQPLLFEDSFSEQIKIIKEIDIDNITPIDLMVLIKKIQNELD